MSDRANVLDQTVGTVEPTMPQQPQIYRAKVTARRTITLPADLRRRLGITAGDILELEVIGGQALLRRAPEKPIPPARGLLHDYFADWEDIKRFIEEERRGQTEETI